MENKAKITRQLLQCFENGQICVFHGHVIGQRKWYGGIKEITLREDDGHATIDIRLKWQVEEIVVRTVYRLGVEESWSGRFPTAEAEGEWTIHREIELFLGKGDERERVILRPEHTPFLYKGQLEELGIRE